MYASMYSPACSDTNVALQRSATHSSIVETEVWQHGVRLCRTAKRTVPCVIVVDNSMRSDLFSKACGSLQYTESVMAKQTTPSSTISCTITSVVRESMGQ